MQQKLRTAVDALKLQRCTAATNVCRTQRSKIASHAAQRQTAAAQGRLRETKKRKGKGFGVGIDEGLNKGCGVVMSADSVRFRVSL